MDTLNLKNNFLLVFLFLLLQCKPDENQNYVIQTEFPSIIIINAEKTEIEKSNLYLRRNHDTIDIGNFKCYSKSGNKVDVQIEFSKKDSLYFKDEILFSFKGKQYIITDFEKKKVISSGVPYIISYKINGTTFVDNEGYIEVK